MLGARLSRPSRMNSASPEDQAFMRNRGARGPTFGHLTKQKLLRAIISIYVHIPGRLRGWESLMGGGVVGLWLGGGLCRLGGIHYKLGQGHRLLEA
jgi:hypothetical protein